jgi:hypothetical protein
MATKSKKSAAAQTKAPTPEPGSMAELEAIVNANAAAAATLQQASLEQQLAEANKRVAELEAQQPAPVQYPVEVAKWKTRGGTTCVITQTAERAFQVTLNDEEAGVHASLTKARKSAKAKAAKLDEANAALAAHADAAVSKLVAYDERTEKLVEQAAKRKAELEARLPSWARKELEVLRNQVKGLSRIADHARKQTRIGYGLDLQSYGHQGHLPSDSTVSFYLEDTHNGRQSVQATIIKVEGRPGRSLRLRGVTGPLVVKPKLDNEVELFFQLSPGQRVKKAARRTDVPAETKQQ